MATYTTLTECLQKLVTETRKYHAPHSVSTPFGRFRTTIDHHVIRLEHHTELGKTVALRFSRHSLDSDTRDTIAQAVVPTSVRKGNAVSLPTYAGKEVDRIVYKPKNTDPIEVEVTEKGMRDLLQTLLLTWSKTEAEDFQFFFHPLGAVYYQDGTWIMDDGKRAHPVRSAKPSEPKPAKPTEPVKETPVIKPATITDTVWNRDDLVKAIVGRNFLSGPKRINCGVAIVELSEYGIIIRDVKNVELVSFAAPDGIGNVMDWVKRNIIPFEIKVSTASIEYTVGPDVSRAFPLTEQGFQDSVVWKTTMGSDYGALASGTLLSPFGSVGSTVEQKAPEPKAKFTLERIIEEARRKEAAALNEREKAASSTKASEHRKDVLKDLEGLIATKLADRASRENSADLKQFVTAQMYGAALPQKFADLLGTTLEAIASSFAKGIDKETIARTSFGAFINTMQGSPELAKLIISLLDTTQA